MTPRRIHRFFSALAAELPGKARVYVTGAAAAALWGRVRPSVDIDFGIVGARHSTWSSIEAAVARTAAITGIPASAAEDIDRWGMITLLDYRRSSRLYRRFGGLEVRLLDPTNWSIGKMTRFLDPDIQDVVQIFRRRRVAAIRAAKKWGRALRQSPRSTTQFQFRANVEHFFTRQGGSVWGKTFDPAVAITAFHRAAGMKPPHVRGSPRLDQVR